MERKVKKRAVGLFCGLLMIALPAQAMSTAEFLDKVDALKAKGPFALFSPDRHLLEQVGEAATDAWQAQVAPPGAPRNACPPPGPLNLSSGQFLGLLRAVPPGRRATTSVTEAVTTGLNRRFACPG